MRRKNEWEQQATDGRTGASPSATETRNRLAPGELVIVAKFHENSQVEWNGGTKEKKRRRMEQETKFDSDPKKEQVLMNLRINTNKEMGIQFKSIRPRKKDLFF